MELYNYQGTKLAPFDSFMNNVDVDYEFDSDTDANYSVIRIYKKKLDGSEQYPFVYCPNKTSAGDKSTYDMTEDDGWMLAINGGIFNTSTIVPDGIVIEDGVSIQNSASATYSGCFPLTIDSSGDLNYAAADASTSTLIANGIVSAVCGFCPIIIDYEDADDTITFPTVSHFTQNAQRQIIGQFGNGDYAIVTCEGRSYQNSDGWTIAEAQTICKKLGLKFAYNLDGGGSTETMLGLKPFNTIYENTKGRIVPTFIVFNGTTTFSIPN